MREVKSSPELACGENLSAEPIYGPGFTWLTGQSVGDTQPGAIPYMLQVRGVLPRQSPPDEFIARVPVAASFGRRFHHRQLMTLHIFDQPANNREKLQVNSGCLAWHE